MRAANRHRVRLRSYLPNNKLSGTVPASFASSSLISGHNGNHGCDLTGNSFACPFPTGDNGCDDGVCDRSDGCDFRNSVSGEICAVASPPPPSPPPPSPSPAPPPPTPPPPSPSPAPPPPTYSHAEATACVRAVGPLRTGCCLSSQCGAAAESCPDWASRLGPVECRPPPAPASPP